MTANGLATWWRRWGLWWTLLGVVLLYVLLVWPKNKRSPLKQEGVRQRIAELKQVRQAQYRELVAHMEKRTATLARIKNMEDPQERLKWLAWYERHKSQLPSD